MRRSTASAVGELLRRRKPADRVLVAPEDVGLKPVQTIKFIHFTPYLARNEVCSAIETQALGLNLSQFAHHLAAIAPRGVKNARKDIAERLEADGAKTRLCVS